MRPSRLAAALLALSLPALVAGGIFTPVAAAPEEKVPEAKAPKDVKPGVTALLTAPKGLRYFLRVPSGYDAKKGARLVVFLHGSNMNGLGYLRSFEAKHWCRDDLLACPNGEQGGDPYGQNNFTFGSAPLVADVVTQVKDAFRTTRTYVGGHSQGGFLTYSVILCFPDLFEGALPMAGDCWMQNEPNLWEDRPEVLARQREIAIAVIHGRADPVVDFSQGRHAHDVFDVMAWPMLKLYAPERLGHEFMLSPVDEALEWLDAMKGDDPAAALKLAEAWARDRNWADATPVARRIAERSGVPAALAARAKKVLDAAEVAAKPAARAMKEAMEADPARKWLPKWFAFRREFGAIKAAAPLARAYDERRDRERAEGRRLFGEAWGLLREGKKQEGHALLATLLDKTPCAYEAYYAVKWLDEADRERGK